MKLTTFQATKTPPLHRPKNQHEGTILGGAPIRFLLNAFGTSIQEILPANTKILLAVEKIS